MCHLSLTLVQIVSLPKKRSYYPYDAIDMTGFALLVSYENGTTETLRNGYTTEYYFSETGTKTVTVGFGGQTTEFTVTVYTDENTPSVCVDEAVAVRGGQLFVPVSLCGDFSLASLTLHFTYDDTLLHFVEVQDYGRLGGFSAEDGTILFTDCHHYTPENAVACIVFDVLQGDCDAETTVTISCNPAETYNDDKTTAFFLPGVAAVAIMEYRYGDVNDDGVVDDFDAKLLCCYVAGWEYEINMGAADFNHDGIVNSKDSFLLRRTLLGLNT